MSFADSRKRTSVLSANGSPTQIGDDDYFDLLPKVDRNQAATERTAQAFGRTGPQSGVTNTDIRERWEEIDLTQKRAAIKEVLVAVIVSPLPKGASKAGPFDPSLLKPIWREDVPEADHGDTITEKAA